MKHLTLLLSVPITFVLISGLPDPLSPADLEQNIARARNDIEDASSRGRQTLPNPYYSTDSITDDDIRALKQKFGFLADYSDTFIRHAKPDCLVKLEATNLKLKEADRVRDADDRLATNRAMAISHPKNIPAGPDDRCHVLHMARFLPGAVCSTGRMFLAARKILGLTGAEPLGNYDMASLGLGGQTTAKGWVDIANPSSTKMSIRSFNINNCGLKSSGSTGKDSREDREFLEVAEFTVALRTIRVAMHLVHHWNMSVVALENFLLANRMCADDIGGLDKQAAILTRFTDYVLSKNAARWKDESTFLDYGELKNTWSAFFSALPQSQLYKGKADKKEPSTQGNHSRNNSSNSSSQPQRNNSSRPQNQRWNLPYIEVCYKWNRGQCSKPAAQCSTSNGRSLKHCCDERTDPTDLSKYCGMNHKRVDAHP